MHYLPHTPEDVAYMLKASKVDSLEALFDHLPTACLRESPMQLPPAMSELALNIHMEALAGENAAAGTCNSFLGAGRYDHFVPHTIPYLLARSEFSTAYTPYQPEVSQGTLQAIFEYQTLISRLLGMEIANASLYDGASALAEALLMAIRITKRKKVAVSSAIHPFYRQVVASYFAPSSYEVIEFGYRPDGTSAVVLPDHAEELAAVAVQSPNFFGCVEDIGTAAGIAHAAGALMVVGFTEGMAFGLVKNPGSQGADIVCGEGQSFGIPMSYGGPGLGVLACRREHVRSLPGRLVGETRDIEGRRGYVLTLATREQHIRREKATSNICTNSGLCAMAAVMFLASAGSTGLRELARLNYDKAVYLRDCFSDKGSVLPFSAPVFNEFVVRFSDDFSKTRDRLLKKRIIPGLALEPYYPELAGHYLLTVTETKTRRQMDTLIEEVCK